jgi:hypothetical protein
MKKKGLNPDFLDTPNAPVESQGGIIDADIPNDYFEEALKYL